MPAKEMYRKDVEKCFIRSQMGRCVCRKADADASHPCRRVSTLCVALGYACIQIRQRAEGEFVGFNPRPVVRGLARSL